MRPCDCPPCRRDPWRPLTGARWRAALVAIATFVTIAVASPDPAPAASGRCPRYEGLLAAHNMPVQTFSRLMFRESRCTPWVRNARSGSTGLLQIHPVNHRWLSRRLGVTVTAAWLKVPANNVRAADELYETFGLRPWR